MATDGAVTPTHLCLLHFGMRVEKLFDLCRVNVLSSSNEHVFNPAVDLAVAVSVQAADVSGGKNAKETDKQNMLLIKSLKMMVCM